MSHAVFALAADHDRCLDSLMSTGFGRAEISLLAPGASGEPATAWAGRASAVTAEGPLSGWLGGTPGVAKALISAGLPIWAAHRYENGLERGMAVIAVHTDNGWEVEMIADLLAENGCQTVVRWATTAGGCAA